MQLEFFGEIDKSAITKKFQEIGVQQFVPINTSFTLAPTDNFQVMPHALREMKG